MATETNISWADHTASPWYGCAHATFVDADGKEKSHVGCLSCYAETMSKRNPGTLGVWGKNGTRVMSASFHKNCLRWNREAERDGVVRSVFPSICDPFEQRDLVEWREFGVGYRVSIYGEVQSRQRAGSNLELADEWRTLDPGQGRGGYVRVNLGFDGSAQTKRVHCLVMELFVGPCPEGQQVRHLDGDPANNMLWNLAYGTSKQNHADRARHGTDASGERNGRSKLTRSDAKQIRIDCAAGQSQESVGKRYGVTQGTVSQIVLGKLWPEKLELPLAEDVARHAAPGQVLDSKGNPLFLENGETTAEPNTVEGWRHPLTLNDLRRDLFATIDACPHLRFLLLTKRPQNVRRMWVERTDWPLAEEIDPEHIINSRRHNVSLLTSISDQATADAMTGAIVDCADLCPVVGLSYEPAIGPVKISQRFLDLGKRAWVILGSESGHNRRPMEALWAESVAEQCKAAGVAFFMKQMSVNGKISGEIESFPPGLRVRQFPCAYNKGEPVRCITT